MDAHYKWHIVCVLDLIYVNVFVLYSIHLRKNINFDFTQIHISLHKQNITIFDNVLTLFFFFWSTSGFKLCRLTFFIHKKPGSAAAINPKIKTRHILVRFRIPDDFLTS